MNILIVTAQPYLPQMRGGLQTSSNTLARELIKKGHRVSLLSALMPEGFIGVRGRLEIKMGNKAAHDHYQGYDVWRAWKPWESLEWVVNRANPDLIIVLARQPVRMALEAKRLKIPVMFMLQDVRFDDHGGAFKEVGPVVCVANSAFTARKYREAFDVHSLVVHPLIDPEEFRTETTRENVTLINPHPDKGVDIAIAVARACPEIPFTFVETWPLTKKARTDLKAELRSLNNVTLLTPVSDMRKIYGKCRILLAPSRCEEAFGRVAVEAQFSAIPVIASTRGGLPEAVGSGGILLDVDAPIGEWITSVQRLWNDKTLYGTLSKAAFDHAKGPMLDIHELSVQWEKIVQMAVEGAEMPAPEIVA